MSESPTNLGQTLEHPLDEGRVPIAENSAVVAKVSLKPAAGPGRVHASGGGLWRPKSSREGIGSFRYVWWNSFYAIMEFLNRKLARDPNRKVSWDRWPPYLGLLYLVAKIKFNR